MGRDEGIKAGDGIWENTRGSYRMGFPALEFEGVGDLSESARIAAEKMPSGLPERQVDTDE